MHNRTKSQRGEPIERFHPFAGALAVLVPGVGHVALGEVKRGLLIGLGVLGLFVGGLFIGGIDVVDSKEDRIWFMGQILVGPIAYGVDRVHQSRFKGVDPVTGVRRSLYPDEWRNPSTGRIEPAGPGQGPPNVKSLGRMNEMGTLYCAIAGMLNLIAILDAFMHRPGGGLHPGGSGRGDGKRAARPEPARSAESAT